MADYTDVTDCMICPQLAGDRDDALAELRAAEAEIASLQRKLAELEPAEAWIIKHRSEVWLCTSQDAVAKLAELAYVGALPGTCAELWTLSDLGWERQVMPWEAS